MSLPPWKPGVALHERIAVAMSAAGALLFAVVVLSVALLLQTRHTQSLVIDDYYKALRSSQTYLVGMIDSETAVRGYALSHQEDTLGPLNQSGQPWAHPISAQIDQLLPGQPGAIRALRKVESDSSAWYEQWAAPAIQDTRSGNTPSRADIERGRGFFDTFRADYTVYIDQLRAGRQVSAQHLAVLTNLLFVTALAAAVLAVATGVILWSLLRRWVTEARIVSGGDISHRVEGTGSSEFQQIGDAMEAMRERLVAQIAAVESAREDVVRTRARVEEQSEELQRSNRELEQFAYVASHDLQEPLRKVASFCQLLERRYAGQLDERANQYIHFAVDGARRMQQLINDLLDFSRVGRLSSSPAAGVDTGACLRVALANVETIRTETHATIEVQNALPVVPGEAPLLTQLFQNLVSNAIKFRAGDAPVVRIGAVRRADKWEFWCSDNGIGIAAEYADRVFLIFQRLHPKEVYEGTGIGLAMCKKIVEYHGGRIWVDTTGPADGHTGTTVRWTLPAEPGALVLPDAEPAGLGAA